ncbi:hypothetical membrane protein [Thermococcus kodakarensis KOD1]|uniref:Hypothetical membrane protein n=1 Tax=Thermococcus kodakarensis (strain ATCC BAA-918 / JCM 12380 / KOD1) TaxID=69014 RepID=Q5JEH2_THEKO|nr:hypothetical protein [Thermococcus kodakarensis]WCN28197.1 hypothetical protein POG15_00445 [Thermococcus kodakarensis]WCN30494.1 hypothetical protein POG21_00445 [Thermococcus kodakarensis]BAD84272.1 hypothetical membrane protein [Thermococcus kodakarensis KOD1]
MSLKSGVLLALAYIVPFALLLPPDSTNSPGAIFLWFLYPITSMMIMVAVAITAWKVFNVDFVPWGLLLLFGSPILTLLFSPIFSLMWGFYIVPTALVFLVGLMEGD